MNTLEKKFLSKVDQWFPYLVIAAATVLGALIRLSLRRVVSIDATTFLLPWYDMIAEKGLYQQVGDYNMVYQFLIWIMTKIPIPPLYAYKILSCGFDYLLAVVSALLVMQVGGGEKLWKAVAVYSLVLLSPVVFINSSAWAQCDSIYAAFAILGLYFLEKEKYTCSLISLGMSFVFKLHAVFILPLYLFVYFVRRRFSVFRFLLIPVTMVAVSCPMLLWGRNLMDIFSIYYSQTATYPQMAANYPSFWAMVCDFTSPEQYVYLKNAAILLTVAVLAGLMIYWIFRKYETTGKNLLIMAFLLTYTCVLFLPAMHERYGYIYEICAILLAVLIPRTIPLCLAMLMISVYNYGILLFSAPIVLRVTPLINLAIYAAYIAVLDAYMKKTNQNL